MGATVIQIGPALARQAEQREREDAARGGYLTTAGFVAAYAAAPPADQQRVSRKLIRRQRAKPLPPSLTITAKNSRLRAARYEAWRAAEAATRFWNALLDFNGAVSIAKRYGVKEAQGFSGEDEQGDRWSTLEGYRAALGRQLLTPAPDVASVIWKRQKLKKSYIGAKRADVEKAIVDDVAFLEAHPTRKGRRDCEASSPDGVLPD